MGKIITWFFAIIFIGMLAYGGWGLYNSMVPPQVAAAPLQTVRLAKGSLDADVSSTGQLRTNQSAQISWDAQGKVATINVKIGDKVKAGQVLATIDPASQPTTTSVLPDTILRAQVDIVLARQALSDLLNTQSTLPAAEKAVIDAQTALDKAQSHRDLMTYPTRGNPQQIASAQANYLRAQQMVDFLRTKYERLPGDPATNHAKAEALTPLQNAKDARDLSLSTLNWYAAPWTKTDIATADNALTVAKAALADAETALAKVKLGPDPQQVAADQRRIDTDQGLLDTQNLVAPIDGVVTILNDKVGDTVKKGDVSIRIDDTSAYFVDLQVSEVDIARIKVGQPATMTFDALPDKTYDAKVTSVAPVGTTTSNGVLYFGVTVQVSNPDPTLRVGFTSATNIVVDTAQNVLVVPSKAVKIVGGQNVVYVLSSTPKDTTPSPATVSLSSTGPVSTPVAGDTEIVVPVAIKVGISSDTSTEIVSNRLQLGDLIVLNPPASAVTAGAALGQ